MAWHSGVDLVEEDPDAGWAVSPVVLMTWAAPRNARYVVERAGAAALVCKPFLVSELRSAARRARQRQRGPDMARAVPATHPMPRWSLHLQSNHSGKRRGGERAASGDLADRAPRPARSQP